MADVSSNNGPINVPNYSRAGHVAIAIKATEGMGYVNPFHETQSNQAHNYGLTVIHYHYCHTHGNVDGEIEHFRNTYNKAWRNGDYACFDIETEGFDVYSANQLLRHYYRLTQREPILYTYRNFVETALKGVKIPGNRIWLADYSPQAIKLPKPYVLWARQYTDGVVGPEPRFYTGIGKSDGSVITAGVARALYLRKLRTRRQK